METPAPKAPAREKLLDAAVTLVRKRGYAATTVDEICAHAGVTKGAFFHHFASKEEWGAAAADYWSATTQPFFSSAPYHHHKDPLDRVLGYIDFRKSILTGDVSEFTCLVGTMVQEVYGTHGDIRNACKASICDHAATLEVDIAAAMKRHGIKGDWTAKSLALHTQAVLQGAFILAKATHSAAIAAESVDHLRRYIELLFQQPGQPSKVRKS
jgi:TetR/AcrR family transcriptional repressor of nem operon